MNAVISAVFFDFGGVILSSPFDAFASYEQRSGLPVGFLRMVNATDPDTNAWARLERNEISVENFVKAFEHEASSAGHDVDARAVLGCLVGELRPAMVEAVRRCRATHHVALLTNNIVSVSGVAPGGAGRFDHVLTLFDEIIESSVVGVRKPDPRFYELACERVGVAASEVVFLDDLGVNLKPARAMGMTTIKVDDPAVALAELERLLGIDLVA